MGTDKKLPDAELKEVKTSDNHPADVVSSQEKKKEKKSAPNFEDIWNRAMMGWYSK